MSLNFRMVREYHAIEQSNLGLTKVVLESVDTAGVGVTRIIAIRSVHEEWGNSRMECPRNWHL